MDLYYKDVDEMKQVKLYIYFLFLTVFLLSILRISYAGSPAKTYSDIFSADYVVAQVYGKKITMADIKKFALSSPNFVPYLTLPGGINKILDEMILRDMLILEGASMNILKSKDISEEIYIRKVLKKLLPKEKKLTSNNLKKFYKEHPEMFSTPLYLRLSTIRVYIQDEKVDEAKKKIQAAARLLKEGRLFKEVVAKFSEDEFSRSRKGDLGFLKAADIEPDSLRKLLIAMKKGQVCGIQHQGSFFAIYKLTDRREPVLDPYNPQMVRKIANDFYEKKAMGELKIKLSKKWGVKYLDSRFAPQGRQMNYRLH